MRPLLSVVICAHNPDRRNLERTLEGLRNQSLSPEEWELLLIDNHSDQPIAGTVRLSWHPGGRVVSEAELGLTPARQRGAKEAKAELLLYVDDDNVLANNYLEEVIRLGREWPMLGAWGAGELEGVFEIEPPDWTRPLLGHLTVHKVEEDRWTNRADMSCFAAGAGLAVRKTAAKPYFDQINNDALRRALDRRGNSLSSSGDMDLLWTLTKHGWGVGRFISLRLQHLIPARRLVESYLENMVASQWCSNILLHYVHGEKCLEMRENWRRRISRWRYQRTLSGYELWFYRARRRGSIQAASIVADLERGADQARTDQKTFSCVQPVQRVDCCLDP